MRRCKICDYRLRFNCASVKYAITDRHCRPDDWIEVPKVEVNTNMNDEYYMQKAIELAYKGGGEVLPNPLVGAVIVKENKIIGQGYHTRYGAPHAEVEAINSVTQSLQDSTMYVTLEPCNHHGKTPPCTELIIQSGIKRVVIGQLDPNELVAGSGINKLKDNNIDVVIPVLNKDVEKINFQYNYFIRKKMPYIAGKIALSLDGKIATYTGDAKWISSENSRKHVHRLRSRYQSILAGKNTLLSDNPKLNIRYNYSYNENYTKIIIGNIDSDISNYNFFKDNLRKILVVSEYNEYTDKICTDNNVCLIKIVRDNNNCIDINKLVYILYNDYNIKSIFIEGGGKTLTFFLERAMVNRLYIYYGNKIIGHDGKQGILLEGNKMISDTLKLTDLKYRVIDDNDFLIYGDLK